MFGYTVQIGGLLHDHATLMAAWLRRQTPMQIDQRLATSQQADLFLEVAQRIGPFFGMSITRFRRRLFLPFSASQLRLAGAVCLACLLSILGDSGPAAFW